MKNLVMLISGRSGSSYLKHLINQDQRVFMLGETLTDKDNKNQKVFLENFYQRKLLKQHQKKQVKVVGFKTKLNDISCKEYFIEQIQEQAPIVIVNRRKNYLRQAISRKRMLILLEKTKSKYGTGHHSPKTKNDIVGQIDVDIEWIHKFIKDFERRDQALERFANSLDCKIETIFYEDFGDNPEFAINKFSSILGFDLEINNFDVTLKNTPAELSDVIINYKELEKSLEGTKYCQMLHFP